MKTGIKERKIKTESERQTKDKSGEKECNKLKSIQMKKKYLLFKRRKREKKIPKEKESESKRGFK